MSCTKCPLHKGKKYVHGAGGETPSVMFVAEGPGFTEDQQGSPFVGKAGMCLKHSLDLVGFDQDSSYLTNVVKHRPTQILDGKLSDRKPTEEEVTACLPILIQEINETRPIGLVLLGRTAAEALNKYMDTPLPLGSLRSLTRFVCLGQQKMPCIITWHPSYVIRQGAEDSSNQAWVEFMTDIQYAWDTWDSVPF